MAIPTFLAYLDPRTPIEVRDQLEREFPDLFQKYSFRGLVLPDFVQPWLLGFEAVLYQDRTDHSLHSLGRRLNIAKLLRVIEALFSVVTSDDLLDNIRAMTEQAMQEQQGTLATNTISSMPEAIEPVQLQHFKPFVYWFWLKVIGGGNIDQLRYYLGNLLALRTIPYIFAEMLQSGKNDDALKLAQSVSQLPGFIQAVSAYPANAPNYFEFIVMYAIGWQVAGYVDLAHAAQRAGNVNVERLYLCAMQDLPDYPWNKLVETFPLELPADPDTWQYENDLQCMLFLSSLDRNFLLP
ncbi:hypothetical protein H4R35_002684 [Dimargaris xerosporica]|nr:hypothetical protein H4R35_002684 [Dimargaris xerosporica]